MSKRVPVDPAFVVAAANIILAVVAFAREMVLGSLLGTTFSADAFAFSLFATDVQANSILAVSIILAGVPVFAGLKEEGREAYGRAVNACFGCCLVFGIALCALNAILAPAIVNAFAAGFPVPEKRLATAMFLLMVPSMPCYICYGLFSAVLHSRSSFTAPALGPVFLNVVFVLGAVGFVRRFGAISLAVAYTLGTLAMVLLQGPALSRAGVCLRPSLALTDPGFRAVASIVCPIAVVQALGHAGYLIERGLAGRTGQGGLSSLTYAFKVSQIPVWVFAAAFGTIAFPALSSAAHKGESRGFSMVLSRSVVPILAVTMPAAVVFGFFPREVVGLIFMRGAFGGASLASTATALRGYALAPVAYGLAYLFMRSCYALQDIRGAAIASIGGSALMIVADAALVRFAGLAGLGLGATAAMLFTTTIILRRVRPWLHATDSSPLRAAAGKIALSVAVMLGVMLLARRCLAPDVERLNESQRLIRVGLVLASGALSYGSALAVSGVLRRPEAILRGAGLLTEDRE